jgi:RNA exonuclease 1
MQRSRELDFSRSKEHLDRRIQQGGAAGHSSVEDSVATLDLVKAYVVREKERARTSNSSTMSNAKPTFS